MYNAMSHQSVSSSYQKQGLVITLACEERHPQSLGEEINHGLLFARVTLHAFVTGVKAQAMCCTHCLHILLLYSRIGS